jgi:hypothetical protein
MKNTPNVQPDKEIVKLSSGTLLEVSLRKDGFLTGKVLGESTVTLYVPESYVESTRKKAP